MSNVGYLMPFFLAPIFLYLIQKVGNKNIVVQKHWILIVLTILLSSLGGVLSTVLPPIEIPTVTAFYFYTLLGICFTLSFQHGNKPILRPHVFRLLVLIFVLAGVFLQTFDSYSLIAWILVVVVIRFFRKLTVYDYWGSAVEMIMLLLLNYNKSFVGLELKYVLMFLFLIRILLLIPNIFISLSSINEIIIREGILLFILSLFVKKYGYFAVNSSYITVLFGVAIILQIFSIFNRDNHTRASLNALSFAPVLLLMSFSDQVIWVQSLYLLVAIYFLYVEVEGVALFSKDVKWITIFPQYFITFLVLPLPGSPLFFLIVDYLKVQQPSLLSLFVLFGWVLFLTLSIVLSVEGRVNAENRSKYINPIKTTYLLVAMIAVIIFVFDRFLFYKFVNDITKYATLTVIRIKLENVGFRFFIVGIPLISVFSIILFYSFRNHPYIMSIKEYLEIFSHRRLRKINSGILFSNIADKLRYKVAFIAKIPYQIWRIFIKLSVGTILIVRSFLFKISQDLNRTDMSTQFIIILFTTFLVFMVAYSYA